MPTVKHFLFWLFFFFNVLTYYYIEVQNFISIKVHLWPFTFLCGRISQGEKNIPLCPGLLIMTLSRISVWGHLPELCLALRGKKNLSPHPPPNASIKIYLSAFTKDLWIKFIPVGVKDLLCQSILAEKSWPWELLANQFSYFISSWCFRGEGSQKGVL